MCDLERSRPPLEPRPAGSPVDESVNAAYSEIERQAPVTQVGEVGEAFADGGGAEAECYFGKVDVFEVEDVDVMREPAETIKDGGEGIGGEDSPEDCEGQGWQEPGGEEGARVEAGWWETEKSVGEHSRRS